MVFISKNMSETSIKDLFCSWVDGNYYREKYKDLQSLSDEQLITHYRDYGFNEGRINSKKHKEYILANLDLRFYNEFHSDDDNLKNTEVIMPFQFMNQNGKMRF